MQYSTISHQFYFSKLNYPQIIVGPSHLIDLFLKLVDFDYCSRLIPNLLVFDRAFTMQAAFTAHGDPSAVVPFAYFPFFIL